MADIRECDIIATLQELREEFALSDAELRQFEAAELTTGSSALRAVGYSLSTTASVVEARGKVTRIPATFTAKLPGPKQVAVKKLYPDFDITFTQATTRAHAMAACCRMLDRQVLKKRSPPGMGIVSVGGNYEHELLTSETAVHSCTPAHALVADCKEAARDVQRMGRLRGIAAGKGDYTDKVRKRVSRFFDDPTEWRCSNLAQDCDYQAGVMLMAHVYDMKLEEVVQSMVSHGARLVLGCVLLTNDMLISDSGTLPTVDGYFEKKDGVINYGFVGEQQWEYSHQWAELRRYAFSGAVVQYGDRQAFYTITERRGDTIFFSLALMPVSVPAVPLRVSWKANDKKRAVVNGYKLSDVNRTTVRKALVPTVFSYPYDPFVKALAYAIERVEKGSFTLEDLQRKTRAIFADTTINSVRVSGHERLDDDQMAYFLSNVGVLAVMSVNRSAVEETVVLAGVKMVRGGLSDSTLVKAGKALRAMWAQPFPNSSTVHKKWRAIVEYLYSPDGSEMLRGVHWTVDYGYRTAYETNRGSVIDAVGAVTVPGFNGSDGRPFSQDILATLVSAAADSEDMALVLAETAATVSPHPVIEEWATALRARFDKTVNAEARKAERVAAERDMDPDVTSMDAHDVYDNARVAELSDAMSTLVNSATDYDDAESSGQLGAGGILSPRTMAERLGVTLESRDEVTAYHIDEEQLNIVADAAIRESLVLLEIEEHKKTDECIKIFARVTDERLNPDIGKMHTELNLCFNVDFWYTGPTGILATESVRKVKLAKADSNFITAAVYLPIDRIIVRVQQCDEVVDGERLHKFRVVKTDGTPYHGLCMTTSFLNIYNGPVIMSNMRNALTYPLRSGTTLTFVEGVPGCGKTHYIIHASKPTSVVVACGRENAMATRSRMQALSAEREEQGLSDLVMSDTTRRVRTLDSALMRPANNIVVDTMFLDECFQDHAGKFWACVKLWKPKSIQALGDSKQIPYIDRNDTGLCHMPMLSHWRLRVGKYISYRCPRDAVAAIARYYDYKIRTNSQITTSMRRELFAGGDPPNLPGWKYLVMYQDDKLALRRKGFRDVNTIGEVQGQTYEKVALVRIQPRLLPLFQNENQVDVALSRHTHEFVYYAPDALDDLVKMSIDRVATDIALVDKYGDPATAGQRIHDV